MIRNILLAALLSVVMFSTVAAKEMTKGGGYTLCKNELKNTYSDRNVDTKLLKVKYTPKSKSRQGITHKVEMRVAGVETRAYKATCVVTRDEDDYTVAFSR